VRNLSSVNCFKMGAAMSVKDVLGEVTLQAVKGHPQVSVIRLSATGEHGSPKGRRKNHRDEMTEADWDKFEKDIEDAFEQVPLTA